MLGRGDWRKLEDSINTVLVPLGERVAALEAEVEALSSKLAARGSTKSEQTKKQKEPVTTATSS